MKRTSFLLSAVMVLSGAFAAAAQSCESFGVTLNVHDNEVKPVANHSIRVTPWLKDDLKGRKFAPAAGKPGTSELKLREGDSVAGNYRIFISAPGYGEVEKTIAFAPCTSASYDILLLKKGEKFRIASGYVSDQDARSIAYAAVTFTDAEGNARTVSTDFIGVYEIKLKPGKYTMRVTKSGFQPYENKKFLMPAEKSVKVNAILMLK